MNSLPSVAVLLHIEMMKLAIVITTPTVLCVVTLTAKQKRQLVAGFMPHMEPIFEKNFIFNIQNKDNRQVLHKADLFKVKSAQQVKTSTI